MVVLGRFLIAGGFNTAIGYGIILIGLWLGLGDFGANALGYAVGIPLAHQIHRRWTFAVRTRHSWSEMLRFVFAFLAAYSVNLGVVWAGLSAGRVNDPLAQLVAVLSYAAVFFLLSRHFVFTARNERL